MKPVVIGALVAAAIVIAFVIGTQFEDESDGPLEQLGETIDKQAGG